MIVVKIIFYSHSPFPFFSFCLYTFCRLCPCSRRLSSLSSHLSLPLFHHLSSYSNLAFSLIYLSSVQMHYLPQKIKVIASMKVKAVIIIFLVFIILKFIFSSVSLLSNFYDLGLFSPKRFLKKLMTGFVIRTKTRRLYKIIHLIELSI